MKKTLNNHYTEDDRTFCRICKQRFKHLGSHVYHAHKLKANQYKGKYGLPYSLSLIALEVEQKKRDHFQKHRKKYLKNISGSQYRFKKGNPQKHRYFARRERERILKIIKNVNETRKPEKCPVCGMIFNCLDSHLFTKHKLIRVKSENNQNNT